MAHSVRILITAGGLLALISQAGATDLGNPYSTDPTVNSTRPKARQVSTQQPGGASPSQASDTPVAATPVTQASVTHAKVSSGAASSQFDSIRPLDVLDISVFEVPELTKTVQVAANGDIDLPLIGQTQAAGKTPMALQQELQAQLGAKYLQNPQVLVSVKESTANQVTISGEIKAPGIYPVTPETTLLQVVSKAGGFAENADSTVLVIRQAGGRRSAARFDVDAIQTGNARDPRLQPGDILVAGTSSIKKGYATVLKILPLAAFVGLAGL
jgi:polysaccharide biosynthesis/export protein